MRVVTAFFFVSLLVACGSSQPQTITEQAAGKTIEVATGATVEVVLDGNPTTGYTWELASPDLSILKQVGEPKFKPDNNAPGAGGKMTLTFEAVATGQAALKLVYHRSFETEAPLKTFEVTVVVK